MTTARDLISRKFVRIGSTHTAAEALGIIFDPAQSALREIVIAVLDKEGEYLGLIEPRDILDSLGTELSVAGADAAAQVLAIRQGLSSPVGELARRDLAAVRLDDNLATLLLAAARTECSALPVFEGREFAGVIQVSAIFGAICQTTLAADGRDLPFMGQGGREE